jgi:glycosyltransferase involved in cell wall biosynthesis
MLSNRIPYPLNDGGAICIYNALKGYADANADLYWLSMNTTKHFVDLSATGNIFDKMTQRRTVLVDNKIRPLDALSNLFSGQSYVVSRFNSKEYERELIQILRAREFDVVHFDSLSTCPYIDTVRRYSKAKIVYRAHNVEYKLWERAAAEDSNPLKGFYIGIQAKRLFKFETEVYKKVDSVLAISTEDQQFIKEVAPIAKVYVFPAGMNIDESRPVTLPSAFSLFFIGALDWLPNLQGLDWFIQDIWPSIKARFPQLKFHIAGKKMPAKFYEYASMNIVAHGEVPSAADFMDQHSVLLSPLVSGSGVRIKIIEAMALGKVVLTTTVSAEGSGAIDGKHILIADNKEQFISQIEKLLDAPELLHQLSLNARNFAIENFQNKRVMAKLLEYYRNL